jgi:hypothetical protein
MKYFDGFGKDVSEYVYELERKAALFDAANKPAVIVEPKIEVEPVIEEEIKKPVRRTTKIAES